mmetsp:Transcript_66922/g.193420  ORF Transcript_66922/g.193420 Transcript_66922/m.193420 type:complete len:218 (+) Transcript_66922:819-1472(+)
MMRPLLPGSVTRRGRSRRRWSRTYRRLGSARPAITSRRGWRRKATPATSCPWRRRGTFPCPTLAPPTATTRCSGQTSHGQKVGQRCPTTWRWAASRRARCTTGARAARITRASFTASCGASGTASTPSIGAGACSGCRARAAWSAHGPPTRSSWRRGSSARRECHTSTRACASCAPQVGSPTRAAKPLGTSWCSTWAWIGALVPTTTKRCFSTMMWP